MGEKVLLKRGEIGSAIIDALAHFETNALSWGDVGILDHAGKLLGLEDMHPLNRHQRILNALDRDVRFEKFYIRVPVCSNNGERRVRAFKLITTKVQSG